MKIKKDFAKWLVNCVVPVVMLLSLVAACSSAPAQDSHPSVKITSEDSIPVFDHVVVITLENKEFDTVIGNLFMPTYNRYARDYALLTEFYAVTHPSLPNYLAMIGGETFDIQENCQDCFINAPSLPDLIEASGRLWKTYQEDMHDPCGLGNQDEDEYVQKHNPFVYFDTIRLDQERCERSVVPFDVLQNDIDAGTLPNFIFITPNMCNNSHDCNLIVTDVWIAELLDRLVPALDQEGSNYLIVLNWDEGQGDGSCCGLAAQAGGRIPVVLISPLVQSHFKDSTPYTHYSLLKTISRSWDLPYLGHAEEDNTALILAPWK